MRSSLPFLLLLPACLACSRSDDAASDTAAAVVPESAAAPAALRPADVSGTWQGTTLASQGDSVLSRWTSITTSDTAGRMVFAGMRDTIPFRATFDGDSMVAVSEPYTRPALRGARAVFRSVGRLRDGKLAGTVVTTLADKPDSVLTRARWEATRAP